NASLAVFALPDANALATAQRVIDRMDELKKSFPEDVDYVVSLDMTPFIKESIKEVIRTLIEAIALVAVVVLLFLQNWRSALIPLIAVPVAVVGTFAVMAAIGFSLNNLTLFGLVLAIGIVVDDAIVVVEAVEHHIEHGMSPRQASLKAMEQVSGPVVAIGLVLLGSDLHLPIEPEMLESLRLWAPIALGAILGVVAGTVLLRPMNVLLGWTFRAFNELFDWTTGAYTRTVAGLLRISLMVL